MKKAIITFGYFTIVGSLIFLNSCQDDPICPNPGDPNPTDTTWIYDSTDYNGNGNQIDSSFCGNNGYIDSSYFGNNPTDSIWIDSIGG